ncbi:MAG: hypothetical protein OXU64_07230 [Gemmatimonadota bacterium]|nr:hypothetical protein [Gemmatimonadota bacterium]
MADTKGDRPAVEGDGWLANSVKWLTLPVLWLTICDASITIYRHLATECDEPLDFRFLLKEHPEALLFLALFAIVPTLAISAGCDYMMRPGQRAGQNGEFEDERRYLHRALSAGLTGIALIVLEPLLGWWFVDISFNFEELLLGSSGLNMLMEETKLTRQYRSMRLSRNAAEEESENLIKQIAGFRVGITETFNSTFGDGKKQGALPRPRPRENNESVGGVATDA